MSARGFSTKRKIPPPIEIPPPPPQAAWREYIPYVSTSILVIGGIVICSLPADVDDDYITFKVGPGMQKGPVLRPDQIPPPQK